MYRMLHYFMMNGKSVPLFLSEALSRLKKKRPYNEWGLTNCSKDGLGSPAALECLKTIYVLSSWSLRVRAVVRPSK
jgi:hypothetical protein